MKLSYTYRFDSFRFQVLGGSADVDGRVLRGDQIMSVNGSDLSQAKQDEAVAVLKVSQGNVKMKVRRYRVRS